MTSNDVKSCGTASKHNYCIFDICMFLFPTQFIIELIKMWMVYHPDVKPTSNDLAYTLAYFCGGLDFDVWLETATSFGLDLSRMKMSYYFDTDDSLSSDGGDADGEFDLEIDSVYGPNGMWEDVALGAAARAGHTGLVRGLLSMHALGESLYHELDVVCRTAVAFGKIDVLKCMSSFNMVESDSMMVARIILDSAVREGQLEVMQWLFSPKEMGGFGFSPDISTMRMYKRLAVAFVRKCPQKFRHVRQCIDAWLLSKQAA